MTEIHNTVKPDKLQDMNSLLPILQPLIWYYQLCFYALANCHEEKSGINMESFCGHQCLATCGKTFGPIEVYVRYDPSVGAWSQSTFIWPSIPECPVYLTIGASHYQQQKYKFVESGSKSRSFIGKFVANIRAPANYASKLMGGHNLYSLLFL